MESIGSLAGGIAHNFNNILAAILGNAELLDEYPYQDNTPKKRIKHIENSAKKAGALVSKLLSFARRDSFEIVPLDLNNLISETLLFKDVLGKKIRITTSLDYTIPTIEGDPGQLEQVIVNLLLNARDAMPDGGFISITTTMTEVKKDRLDIPVYIEPGEYVLLTISDPGQGIPENIKNRIFDPFFTTKERGKGTGLGLSTAYGIIKDHKGYITLHSEVGKGSTFNIYLPVSGKPIPETVKPQQVSLEGHEKVLVVDDEDDVLDYIKDVLENHGYEVIPTNNPLLAIDIFKEFSNELELVITDIVMPLMEGTELIRNLKMIKPDIKTIAVSGYSDRIIIDKEKLMIDAFIKKPFEGDHLLLEIRRLLGTEIEKIQ
jgi:two-component system cell cycle sensor histidine kinase/response regulator CckA